MLIYFIDQTPVHLDLEGTIVSGPATAVAPPLAPWPEALGEDGFIIARFLDSPDFARLLAGLTDMVKEAVAAVTGRCTQDFTLERYHRFCARQEHHLAVVSALRERSCTTHFPIDPALVDQCVSELCGTRVSCWSPAYPASGFFFIRLIRPHPHTDANPPHRDSWLDYLRDGLNLYVPLAGSTAASSLSVVPGSHRWEDSSLPRTASGARVNGAVYTVPALATDVPPLHMTRPPVRAGECMIFSPYLLHGGAVNFNPDSTRVSLEMRFWKL